MNPILQVLPGVYEVQASLVGYHTVSKTDVAVSIDRTSPVDFALTESTVELSEITVVAERPPVELEVSYAWPSTTILRLIRPAARLGL